MSDEWWRQTPRKVHFKSYSCPARFRRFETSQLEGVTCGHCREHALKQIRRRIDFYAKHRGRCFWCGKDAPSTWHMDHYVPRFLGGSDGDENLVLACQTCNLRKGKKDPIFFRWQLQNEDHEKSVKEWSEKDWATKPYPVLELEGVTTEIEWIGS